MSLIIFPYTSSFAKEIELESDITSRPSYQFSENTRGQRSIPNHSMSVQSARFTLEHPTGPAVHIFNQNIRDKKETEGGNIDLKSLKNLSNVK